MAHNALTQTWLNAITDGTFVTAKHNPASTGTVYPEYRSITATDPSGLYEFFRGGNYSIQKYTNLDKPKSPEYYVVKPIDPAFVPASGVPAMTHTPTHSLDRFVVVSGVQQGWHVFAESNGRIDQRVKNRSLVPENSPP